jgi:hypothetical protein
MLIVQQDVDGVVKNPQRYHWYRENDDGTWSEKDGDRAVNECIKDPLAHSVKVGINWRTGIKNCGYLCIPEPGIDLDK